MAKSPLIGLLAAGVTLLAATVPANAEWRSKTVEYNDLDLSTNAGQARLETRIKSAVQQVCGKPYIRNFSERKDAEKCAADAMQNAQRKMEIVIVQYRDGRRLAANPIAVVGN